VTDGFDVRHNGIEGEQFLCSAPLDHGSASRFSLSLREGNAKILKIYERSQEVIENKGPHLWKAKRSMKTKRLDPESQDVADGHGLMAISRAEKRGH
jgi:hypothetical protein